jgi:hypothetical protein
MMRGIPLVLFAVLLASCSTTEKVPVLNDLLNDPEKLDSVYPIHRLYEGGAKRPQEVAILLVATPSGRTGIGVVGRVARKDMKIDFRPEVRRALLEVLPGRYELELWYWIGRSSVERTGAGQGELRFQSLRSAEKAVMQVEVKAGEAYYIDPELKHRRQLYKLSKEGFYKLMYGEQEAQAEDRDASVELRADYLWRPHFRVLTDEQAKRYYHIKRG